MWPHPSLKKSWPRSISGNPPWSDVHCAGTTKSFANQKERSEQPKGHTVGRSWGGKLKTSNSPACGIYEEIELRISPRNTKTLWINQLMMIGSTARCGSNTRKNIHGQKCLKVVVALGDSLNFIQDLNQKMAIPTADLSKTEGTSIPLRLSNFHPHLSIALSCIIILQSWLISLYKKKYKEWWSPSRDT